MTDWIKSLSEFTVLPTSLLETPRYFKRLVASWARVISDDRRNEKEAQRDVPSRSLFPCNRCENIAGNNWWHTSGSYHENFHRLDCHRNNPSRYKFSYCGIAKSDDKYVPKTSETKNIAPVISSACMQTDVRFSTEIIITTNDWHSRSHIHKQTDLQDKRTSMCHYCVPSNCTTFQSKSSKTETMLRKLLTRNSLSFIEMTLAANTELCVIHWDQISCEHGILCQSLEWYFCVHDSED